jgi:predicted deacylase
MSRQRAEIGVWGADTVAPGARRRLRLEAGESFMGTAVRLPVMVWRAPVDGPVVGITAAVHGDEINGTGAIRRLVLEPPFELERGALILVPVVNVMAFERHSRYSPDRRDLNRSFPGTARGSLSSRMARLVFDEIVARCDYLIDIHTAAVRRTNFPNVRADLSNAGCAQLARAFGCELILDGTGPAGSLRREATESGCPAFVLEAGEVFKIEAPIQDLTVRGVRNVLVELGMAGGRLIHPPHTYVATGTRWVRAENGGFVRFHVAPGDRVVAGQPLATNTSLLGRSQETLTAPEAGLVIGMTTMPAVAPGDPVVHVALLDGGDAGSAPAADTLEQQIREHLASNLTVIDAPSR